jgi:hypothetical protein
MGADVIRRCLLAAAFLALAVAIAAATRPRPPGLRFPNGIPRVPITEEE